MFAAAVYKEKKMQRNKGTSVSSLDDRFSVFQSLANTPAYRKTGKMEMIARLDNQGPFHIFFTLRCADIRWKENIVAERQICTMLNI